MFMLTVIYLPIWILKRKTGVESILERCIVLSNYTLPSSVQLSISTPPPPCLTLMYKIILFGSDICN